jgi:hypothetical protein
MNSASSLKSFPWPRLVCTQADYRTTVTGGDFREPLSNAFGHLLQSNRNIRNELSRHRIIVILGVVDTSDLGLVMWENTNLITVTKKGDVWR